MTEREDATPLVRKTDEGLLKLTDHGHEQLAPWVTSTTDDVYAFTGEADPEMVAAAFARLSRNSNGVRAIIGDEFFDKDNKDSALLRRVVTAFGDDSVMQLYPVQVVFEDISNIATKAVERGRFGAYLEQSSRYLRFDKKDEDGNYRYHRPEEFDEDTAELFKEKLDEIFDIYSELYQKLFEYMLENTTKPEDDKDIPAWKNACHAQACDAIRGILPAATTATVGFEGSAQALYNMILHLESENLPELNTIGRAALTAIRSVAPVFFERVDLPTQGGLISDNKSTTRTNSREHSKELLESFGVTEQETGTYVRLIKAYGDEDDLIAKIIADSSQMSFGQIEEVVAQLTDEQKREIVDVYVGERYNRRVKPGRAFELPHYLVEVQCDYGAFRDIARHRAVDAFDWQQLQPYLGHAKPEVIDKAGVTDLYESAFSISQELYENLSGRGYVDQAQYATLFGHNMRFTLMVNARALTQSAELRTTPQGHPSYRKVYQDIYAAVEAEHPHVARVMTFLNQGEDPELARQGAEIAQLRKLEKLDAHNNM